MMRKIVAALLFGGAAVLAQPTTPAPILGPLTVQGCGWECCSSGSSNDHVDVMPLGVNEACVEWGTGSKFQVQCDQQGFFTAWVWEALTSGPKQCNSTTSAIVGTKYGLRGDGSCQSIEWGVTHSNYTQTNYFNVKCPVQPSPTTTPNPNTTPYPNTGMSATTAFPNSTLPPTATPRPFSSTGANGYYNYSSSSTGSFSNLTNTTFTYYYWNIYNSNGTINYGPCSASCWNGSYPTPTRSSVAQCFRQIETYSSYYPYYSYSYYSYEYHAVDDSECQSRNITNWYLAYPYYTESCNTQRCIPTGATYTWINGTIGTCSAPPPCHVAGTSPGYAYRNVTCQQTDMYGFTTPVDDTFCYSYSNTSRPQSYVECNTMLCHNYQWIITPTNYNTYLDDGWAGCTAACDGGIQTREVKCRDLSLSVNYYSYYYPLYDDRDVVPDSFCAVRGPKPITQRPCNTQSCASMSFSLGDPCYYYNLESLCLTSPNGTTTSAIAVCQYQSYPYYRYTWQLQSYCYGPNTQCDNVGLHAVCVPPSTQPTNPTTVVPTVAPTANPTAAPTPIPTATPTNPPSNGGGGGVVIGANVMVLTFNINFTFPFPQFKSTDKFSVQQIDAAMRYIASQANIPDANVVMDDALIRRVAGLVDGRTGKWQVSIGFKGTDSDQVSQAVVFLQQLGGYQTATATAIIGVSTGSAEVSVTPSSAASGVSFDPTSSVGQNQQRVMHQTCPDGSVIDASATCGSIVLSDPSSKSIPLIAIVVPVVVGVMLLVGVAVAVILIHRRRSAAKRAAADSSAPVGTTAASGDATPVPVPATSVVVV